LGCDLDVDDDARSQRRKTQLAPLTTANTCAESSSQPAMVRGSRSRKELIDVDFRNVEVHNALRLLAEVGKINIVIGDEVRGSVTLRLRRVTWKQALDAVVGLEQLRLVHDRGVYRVEPR
jgi:type IV pilus assembly protein PilQ